MYAGPRQLQRLIDAVMTVGTDLELPVVLRRIVEAGQDLVDARYAALGVLDPTRTFLTEFITAGMTDAEREAIGELPKGHGILGVLITNPKPLRLPDLGEHEGRFGFPAKHPPMTSFLGVPLYVHGEVFGNLYFTEKVGGDPFTDIDEELATGLAAAAAVAIQNARLHEQMQELSLVADRERLGRELHDTVIQRLFSTGLSMQATARLSHEPEVQDRVFSHIEELDEIIREVRSAIFQMERRRMPGPSVRQDLLAVTSDAGRALGFEPVVLFDGPLDSVVPALVGEHLVAVLREALSNVVRHAHATAVEVAVQVTAEAQSVSLEVRDNGIGRASDGVPGNGVANMRARADLLGGSAELVDAPGAGTVLRWTVPIVGERAEVTETT